MRKLLGSLALLLAFSGRLFAQDLRPSAYLGKPKTVTVRGSKIQGSTGGVTTLAQQDITPTVNATTYIYVDLTSTPVIGTSTSGFPSSNFFPICTVTADINGNVTTFIDNRPDAFMAGGGVSSPYNLNGIRFVDGVKFPTTDLGAGVNAAFADFGAAPACGIVYLPLGIFNQATAINITGRQGCRLIGQGDGQSSSIVQGTYIKWTGSANGTMLAVAGCYECEVTGFTLDGQSSAGIGIQYTNGGGLTSQQSSFHDITELNILGTPGQGIYVGSAVDAQISESRFDRIFQIAFKTGVRQEGINTLNVTYKDFSMTATAATTGACFDIQAGNFRGIHNTCEAPPATAIAAYNMASGVTAVDILDSYVEGSGAPVLNAPGASNVTQVITLIGNNFGTSASNTNFFTVTANGSLNLFGNGFHGTTATATYTPPGLVASGNFGLLVSRGNQWLGVTLTSGGTAYAADVDDGSFTTTAYNNVLSAFSASHTRVIDSTNVQLVKSPLSFYDGTTRYNVNVASTGLQVTNSAGSTVGGWNIGNPGASATFESRNLGIATINLRNGATFQLMASSTAPTLSPSTGFNTGSISASNGTAAFTVTVGSGTANNNGTISLPAASHGWACTPTDLTTPATNLPRQSASTTTTAVMTNFNTAGTATNWTNGDVLSISCSAY